MVNVQQTFKKSIASGKKSKKPLP